MIEPLHSASELRTPIHMPPFSSLTLIAPSGRPLDEGKIPEGIAHLKRLGFEVRNLYRSETAWQRFGGNERTRLEQIRHAFSAAQPGLIMGVRGGYGVSRLLQHLDWVQLAQSRALLCGYSDFTALHLALLRHGRLSLAGPMLCDDFTRPSVNPVLENSFLSVLSNEEHRILFTAPQSPDVQCEGVLWGGNLTVLTHLLGTPFFPDIPDGILFLEDVGEHPYRVERMLLQLQHAGVLDKQRAILLGAFTAYRLAEHDRGYDFAQMCAFLRSELSPPLLTGLPFGHIPDRQTLVVGSYARLLCHAEQAQLAMTYTL